MRQYHRIATAALIIALFSILVGIVIHNKSNNSPAGTARFRVLLRSQENVFPKSQSLTVAIQSTAISSDETGWHTLQEEPLSFDILQLVEPIKGQIGEATIKAGVYQQLQIVFGEASIVDANREFKNLHYSSDTHRTVTLDGPFSIRDGQVVQIELVFDIEGSLRLDENNGYELRPVIRVGTVTTQGDSFVSKKISAKAGGSLILSDGFLLSIPPGALPHDMEISVERIPPEVVEDPEERYDAGATYHVEPDGLELLRPVLVEMPYDPELLRSDVTEEEIRFSWDMELLPAKIDKQAKVFRGYVTHF